MKKPQTDEVQTALLAVAFAACTLLVTSCGETSQTTTTTTASASASTAPAAPIRPADPTTGPGAVDDTAQTAALSPPANSNGTTPARGVSLPPSR